MNKETIELVKKMIEDGNLSQKIAEKYCPEINNSDERIRKTIIAGINKIFDEYSVFEHTTKDEALAWIEKQEHLNWTENDEINYTQLRIFIQCFQKDKNERESMLEWIKTLRPQINYDPDELSKTKIYTELKLTWEDIREMYILFESVNVEIELGQLNLVKETLGYYQEILKRFINGRL
jgi:hypothetical protein